MMNKPTRPETLSNHRLHFLQQRQIRSAFGLCLGFTLLVGLTLAVMFRNPWWLVWSGLASLLFGGIVVAALVGTGNFLSGVLIAILYFSTVALIYLVGQVAEVWLPPWPSLPHHASTYFFLWPLALVLAGVLRLLVVGFNRRFGREAGLISLRLIPIMTALSVILLTTFRPLPPSVAQPEWQQPPLAEGDVILNEFMVTPLATDAEGGLWFGYKKLTGGGGVGHFAPGDAAPNSWQIYPARTDDDGPRFDFVLSLLPDGHQEIWISSLKGGLNHYDEQTTTWQAVTGFRGDVLAMVNDGQHLWLGTFGEGVICFDTESRGWEAYTQATTGGGLQDDEVTVLITDSRGGLWIGTYGGGISHYDPARDTWQAFTVASTGGGLGSNDVRTLLIDEAGALWVGTFGGGISRYSPRLNTWELYTTETTGGGLVSDYVLTLLPGENGELWAGLSNLRNQGGLAYFDGERWRSYTVISTDGSLLSNDVRALALDGAEGLWIGTRDGGLSHLAADRQTWTTFTVKSTGGGLAGNTVLALLPDGTGNVWVGTGSGLSHLHWSAP